MAHADKWSWHRCARQPSNKVLGLKVLHSIHHSVPHRQFHILSIHLHRDEPTVDMLLLAEAGRCLATRQALKASLCYHARAPVMCKKMRCMLMSEDTACMITLPLICMHAGLFQTCTWCPALPRAPLLDLLQPESVSES